MGKKKLTDTGVGLHSGIRGGMLECRLPIRQPLCWNGQMEGIYTSVSSALIGDGPTSRAPVAIRADQSISRRVFFDPPSSSLIRFHRGKGKRKKKKKRGTIPSLLLGWLPSKLKFSKSKFSASSTFKGRYYTRRRPIPPPPPLVSKKKRRGEGRGEEKNEKDFSKLRGEERKVSRRVE